MAPGKNYFIGYVGDQTILKWIRSYGNPAETLDSGMAAMWGPGEFFFEVEVWCFACALRRLFAVLCSELNSHI